MADTHKLVISHSVQYIVIEVQQQLQHVQGLQCFPMCSVVPIEQFQLKQQQELQQHVARLEGQLQQQQQQLELLMARLLPPLAQEAPQCCSDTDGTASSCCPADDARVKSEPIQSEELHVC